ncbi:MAG TPA: MauE/DoxX family redox-associated membrane protein [Actinomycetota bacterium]
MTSRVGSVVWRLAVRLVPAGLLLWAGLAKAFDRQDSILAVDAYDVLPEGLVTPVASVLPWVEIGVALLLVLGLFLRFAGATTAVLATLFVAGMVQAKARGLRIDCGCFGGGGAGEGVTWWDIARDVPVLLAGIYLFARPRGPLQLDNLFEEPEATDGRDEADDEARAPAGGR